MKPVLRVIPFLFLIGTVFSTWNSLTISPPKIPPLQSEGMIKFLNIAVDPNNFANVYVLTGTAYPNECWNLPNPRDCYAEVVPTKKLAIYASLDYGRTWELRPFELATDADRTYIRYFKQLALRGDEVYELLGTTLSQPKTDPTIPLDTQVRSKWFYYFADNSWRKLWQLPASTVLRYYTGISFLNTGLRRFNGPDYDYYNSYPIQHYGRSVISPGEPTLIYVAIDGYGVLVGPNPAIRVGASWEYHLSKTGLPIDTPLFRDQLLFSDVLLALVMLLFIPPLPYLNGWALMQAYRYAFQPGEEKSLRRYTWLITGIATLAYLVPLTLALTRDDVDFKLAVLALGVLNVVIGAVGGWWISRKRGFTTAFTRKMILGCGLLALAVPLGLYFGLLGWIALFTLWCAFVGCRAALSQFLEKEGGVGAQWGIDRMALEIPGLFIVIVPPLTILGIGVFAITVRVWNTTASFFWLYLIIVPLLIIGAFVSIVIRYLKFRVRQGAWLVKKKAALPGGAGGARSSDRSLYRKLFDYTWIWVSGTVTVCLCLAFAVMTAPAWFQMLFGL
jgi:hypothetical protein